MPPTIHPALANPPLALRGTVSALRLLATAAERSGGLVESLYIVGGFVRDVLLGHPTLDFDMVVVGKTMAFANSLSQQLGGQVTTHPSFGTATWYPPPNQAWLPPQIDFATTRIETYSAPAALPTVKLVRGPDALFRDTFRRDFTINAMAFRLYPPPFGLLIDPRGGREDLRRGLIQVMHSRSFIDDPTRIFRAARFAVRLNFQISPATFALIPSALQYVPALSGERIRHEFDLIFTEADPAAVLNRLSEWGVLDQIGLMFDEKKARALRWVQAWLKRPTWAVREPISREAVGWILLTAGQPDPLRTAARFSLSKLAAVGLAEAARFPAITAALAAADRPSAVDLALRGLSDEALLALWATLPDPAQRDQVAAYADRYRHQHPTLDGNFLRALGLKPGPLFGKLLTQLREALLNGEVVTPDDEAAWLRARVENESGEARKDDRN